MIDAFSSIRDVQSALGDGTVSRREVLTLARRQYLTLNPIVNAIVTVDPHAEVLASHLDKSALDHGALDGVTVTVKDSFETKGLRTTAAARELAGHIPKSDAVGVERVRAAGSLLLGKTSLPRFASDLQTSSSLFGTTRNPWDVERTPGGSSGGGAVAVASGMSAIDLASDHAGSVRLPAAFCGVIGHKPTYGLIPTLGHIPPSVGSVSERDLTTVGILGRYAEDVRRTLGSLVVPTRIEARAWSVSLPTCDFNSGHQFRAAVWLDAGSDGEIDRALRASIEHFVAALEPLGVELSDSSPPFDLGEQLQLFHSLLGATIGPMLDDDRFELTANFVRSTPSDDHGTFAEDARSVSQSHRAWLQAHEQRVRLKYSVDRWFDHYDVLIVPATLTSAPLHMADRDRHSRLISVNGKPREYFEQLNWLSFATTLGLPATVFPIGLGRDGLPMSVQVVGKHFGDETCLAFVAMLEVSGLSQFRRPPSPSEDRQAR